MQLSLFDANSERSLRQEELVDTWVKHKCKGTVVCPTGFGKTKVGLIAIRRFLNKNPDKVVLVIVPSDPIKVQWEKQISELNLQAVVRTYYDTSRNKYEATLVILDEIQKTGAETLFNTFSNISYRAILGLTATFERLDGRDRLISKYCPVIAEVTLDEAIAKGWLSSYREYLVLVEPDDIDKYNELNREFNEHFAFFDYNFALAMSLATNWQARIAYGKERGLSKEENKEVLIHAMGFNRTLQGRKKYINNHPKKIEIADLILSHRQDRKCITFSNTIAMAEKIGYGDVYSGKDSVKKGRIKLEEFLAKPTGVVNSVRKLSEGFNDPSISVAIFLGFDSSKTKKTQSVGRVIRAQEGKVAEVFNIVIKNSVEYTWFQNSCTNKDYITIDEENLINLLEGKEFTKKKNKQTKMKFRF